VLGQVSQFEPTLYKFRWRADRLSRSKPLPGRGRRAADGGGALRGGAGGCYPTFNTYIAKLLYMPVLMYRYLLTMQAVAVARAKEEAAALALSKARRGATPITPRCRWLAPAAIPQGSAQ
jgi:hypothetical protein